MANDHFLDVLWIYIHATRDDHVFHAIDEKQESVVVEIAEISGVQPSVDDGPLGEVRTLVIPGHLDRPPSADLTDFTRRALTTALVEYSNLEECRWRAHGSGFALGIRLVGGPA